MGIDLVRIRRHALRPQGIREARDECRDPIALIVSLLALIDWLRLRDERHRRSLQRQQRRLRRLRSRTSGDRHDARYP